MYWLFGGQLISANFFYNAMNHYRESFGTSKFNVLIFVIVSDDLRWCKKTFENMSDVYFVSKDNSAFLDMAILSNCNHSIIDFGTFGQWGAFLAGGQTIWARDFSRWPMYNPPVMMKYFPKWTFLSDGLYKWERWQVAKSMWHEKNHQ